MNKHLSKIKSLFPGREVCSIYDIKSSKSDVVVVEDWTFFQFTTKCTFKAIVIATSVEDYVDWRRMLRTSVLADTEVYILFNNLSEQNKTPVVDTLMEQDKSSGVEFLN